MEDMPAAIADLPRDVLELKADNVVGLDALRSFFERRAGRDGARGGGGSRRRADAPLVGARG